MRRLFSGGRARDLGATSAEYALLATLIAVAVAIAIGLFGIAVLNLFSSGVDDIPWGG